MSTQSFELPQASITQLTPNAVPGGSRPDEGFIQSVDIELPQAIIDIS